MSEAPLALRFSHVGLFVTAMAPMVDFYSGVLGFAITDHGRLGDAVLTFLSRDPREHHQLVLVEGRPPGLPDRIVNQVSFRLDTLGELRQFWRRIARAAPRELVAVTHGNAWSVYFRDPEGNRLEVFTDTPWHVTQPVRSDRPQPRRGGDPGRDRSLLPRPAGLPADGGMAAGSGGADRRAPVG